MAHHLLRNVQARIGVARCLLEEPLEEDAHRAISRSQGRAVLELLQRSNLSERLPATRAQPSPHQVSLMMRTCKGVGISLHDLELYLQADWKLPRATSAKSSLLHRVLPTLKPERRRICVQTAVLGE